MRIYIAGPYSRGIPDETMARVTDAADKLRAAGHAPFIPHTMTFLWAVRHQHEVDYWYAFDLEWLAVCEGIVRLPGDSKGADAEVEFAKARGIPVFTMEELCAPKCLAKCQGINGCC
jgi:hypothetical protein